MKAWEKWYSGLCYRERAGYRIMYPDLSYEKMYERMMKRFGMILRPPVEIITRSLIKNPNINPVTGRKIKPFGPTYQKLMKMTD